MADKKFYEVEQVKSAINQTKRVKATLETLGLGRIGKKRTLPANDSVKGKLVQVRHLVYVTEA